MTDDEKRQLAERLLTNEYIEDVVLPRARKYKKTQE
jgi:hypothetical protein